MRELIVVYSLPPPTLEGGGRVLLFPPSPIELLPFDAAALYRICIGAYLLRRNEGRTAAAKKAQRSSTALASRQFPR